MKIAFYRYNIRNLAICLACCIGLAATTSFAMASPEKAKDFIQEIGDKVIAIVTTDKITADAKEKQLNDLFIETVDINWIAKFVVGKYWRESTPEQQQTYLKLYKHFLVSSYVSKFRQYTDQKMLINKFSAEDSGYFIETTINDNGGKSYNVAYKTKLAENGKFKIYDIIAEGVSLITTQRSEFSSILAREGMDALIKKLGQKN